MGFIIEHSAVNYTAEHYKPLFWRRLATKLSPLVVPQLCPQLAFLNILSSDSLQGHEVLFFRCASFLQKDLNEAGFSPAIGRSLLARFTVLMCPEPFG
jgi:hypothetical protein